MWKPLALASLALSLRGLAAAQDAGLAVVFPGTVSELSFTALPGGARVVYETPESAGVAEPWDSILIQGESPDAGLAFEFSRRRGSGGWGPWTLGQVRRRSDGRFWAKARLGPAAPGTLRLRAIDAAVRSSHLVELYSIEVFDSAQGDAAGGLGAAKAQLAQRPDVHSRAEWGAKAPKEGYAAHVPRRMTLHHTATRRTASLADSSAEVGFIQDFHQNGRGWNDIGYHYLVDSLGNVFAGRPESAVGAHVKGANTGNLGVSMLGFHHPPKNDPVAAATLEALTALGRAFIADYGVTGGSLRGHRDFGSGTQCPGDLGYAAIPELKRRLSEPAALAPDGEPRISLKPLTWTGPNWP